MELFIRKCISGRIENNAKFCFQILLNLALDQGILLNSQGKYIGDTKKGFLEIVSKMNYRLIQKKNPIGCHCHILWLKFRSFTAKLNSFSSEQKSSGYKTYRLPKYKYKILMQYPIPTTFTPRKNMRHFCDLV